MIKPVALPAVLPRHSHPADAAAGAPARRSLPLPTVPTPHAGNVVYGLGAVDCRGRVADRVVLAALGWTPGTRLDIRESRGLLIVREVGRDEGGCLMFSQAAVSVDTAYPGAQASGKSSA